MSGRPVAHTSPTNRAYLHCGVLQSELLARHEVCQLLDEDMTEKERHELEEAEEVCRKFLAWELSPTDGAGSQESVRDRLVEVLGRTVPVA